MGIKLAAKAKKVSRRASLHRKVAKIATERSTALFNHQQASAKKGTSTKATRRLAQAAIASLQTGLKANLRLAALGDDELDQDTLTQVAKSLQANHVRHAALGITALYEDDQAGGIDNEQAAQDAADQVTEAADSLSDLAEQASEIVEDGVSPDTDPDDIQQAADVISDALNEIQPTVDQLSATAFKSRKMASKSGFISNMLVLNKRLATLKAAQAILAAVAAEGDEADDSVTGDNTDDDSVNPTLTIDENGQVVEAADEDENAPGNATEVTDEETDPSADTQTVVVSTASDEDDAEDSNWPAELDADDLDAPENSDTTASRRRRADDAQDQEDGAVQGQDDTTQVARKSQKARQQRRAEDQDLGDENNIDTPDQTQLSASRKAKTQQKAGKGRTADEVTDPSLVTDPATTASRKRRAEDDTVVDDDNISDLSDNSLDEDDAVPVTARKRKADDIDPDDLGNAAPRDVASRKRRADDSVTDQDIDDLDASFNEGDFIDQMLEGDDDLDSELDGAGLGDSYAARNRNASDDENGADYDADQTFIEDDFREGDSGVDDTDYLDDADQSDIESSPDDQDIFTVQSATARRAKAQPAQRKTQSIAARAVRQSANVSRTAANKRNSGSDVDGMISSMILDM